MAYATGTYVAMAAMAAAAAMQAHNTAKTAKRQDNQLAESIRSQSKLQREQDARVNEEVQKLGNSTMEESRAKRMDQFMQQLGRNRAGVTASLTPQFGSDAFVADSNAAAEGVLAEAGDTAGLLARMDAPGMQRQGEANSFGHLATDTDLLKRRSQGQQFIDDIRLRAIRRNPYIDLGAGILGAVGKGMGGMGSAGGAGGGLANSSAFAPVGQGGSAVYRVLGANSGYGMA